MEVMFAVHILSVLEVFLGSRGYTDDSSWARFEKVRRRYSECNSQMLFSSENLPKFLSLPARHMRQTFAVFISYVRCFHLARNTSHLGVRFPNFNSMLNET